MSQLPRLKDIALRDTPFADLMRQRVYNVLLIATKYDAFMLEDDGRVDEQIFNEYSALGLRYPPRFTQVSTKEEAMARLGERSFELIIVMPNMSQTDTFATAREIKQRSPAIPIVVLTPFSREVSKRMESEDLSSIDYVFSWLGNAELLLAIIKLLEDKWNAPHDVAAVGVQIILLVEDSVRFYSGALPHLFRIVLEQSLEFSKEALNDHLKTLRMRGRPKIMLARTYEEAREIFDTYRDNILGIVSDMSFGREGKKDPEAGYRLARYVKSHDAHIPVILESSEEANRALAESVGAAFISKHSKRFPQDLHREVMNRFGFGDFIIRRPSTGEEIMRIRTLKDLQRAIPNIPDDSLRYHLARNHFSRFFFSRAMFPPAVILRRVDVNDYEDMQEARELIADLIASFRRMKNAGVVAVYQRDRFDEFGNYARIGNGSLGGKGRGLAFMAAMLQRHPKLERENFAVSIPKTVVVCTDVFDEFMERNNLYPIALSDAADAEILDAFLRASLPEHVTADLEALYDVVGGPVAVRSSSLLEDSHYQPFAGIYSTYMVPRRADKDESVLLMRSAIKAVYASVFYRDSKAYLTATQNLIEQEKMAIVLQEVVGTERDGCFYPVLSGVARSLNFYPIGAERAEDGIANVALGLGKYIVDGAGPSLRFSPRHPHHILQLSEVDIALRDTQTRFLALDLSNPALDFAVDDGFNLVRLPVRRADEAGSLRFIASTYDPLDQIIRDGIYPGGRKIISLSGLLEHERFPLADTIDRLLSIGAEEMGRPVEIEFAMDITGDSARFCLLQIRPIVDARDDARIEPSELEPRPGLLLSCRNALGNGTPQDVSDVVYVRSAGYKAADNALIAREVERMNARLMADGRHYVLVGPGRWGTSDEWLGIPVKWPHIGGAALVVERRLEGYCVEASQGTHFFQNLTSLGVGYFTIEPDEFDEAALEALPAEEETPHLRLVHFPAPLTIRMDGRRSLGFVST